MDNAGQGSIVLGVEIPPEARDKLVAALLRVYRTRTPDQLLALVSRPKPITLAKGVDASKARKFIEALGEQGIPLVFVPAAATATAATASQWSPQRAHGAQGEGAEQALGMAAASPTRTLPGDSPPAQPSVRSTLAPKPAHRRVAMQFTGSASEYFRIWIVNVALTILTLGIYAAWAKVRTRRYFYANTVLDGRPFDYAARPGTILKGHLVVAGALVLMNVANKLSPLLGGLVSAAAWCAVPFLLYKAHRFKAQNSRYRNIRFRFLGTLAEAYKAYALIPIAVVLVLVLGLPALLGGHEGSEASLQSTGVAAGVAGLGMLLLGIGFPWFLYLQRKFFHGNLAYGRRSSIFTGGVKRFYGIYTKASLMLFGITLVAGVGVGLSGAANAIAGGKAGSTALLGIGALSYALGGVSFLLVQQYIYASTFNYSWNHTRLGPITFDVNLRARDLAWIQFTNVLAILFSLGLLTPWAKIRRAGYILPLTTALLPDDMESFQTTVDSPEGAVGDTAADFFDWDIGW